MKNAMKKLWGTMLSRCEDPRHEKYPSYGGRGIVVCHAWHKFENFYSDMGDRPFGWQIDRKDNDGPYSPENCRWASRSQQARNRRDTNLLSFNGQTLSISDWSDLTGVKRTTIRKRLKLGWSADKVLTRSIRKQCNNSSTIIPLPPSPDKGE